jgi:hypothetical protein
MLVAMQLMNWYIENHVILEDDNQALRQLKGVEPPRRSRVLILVSCQSLKVCADYAAHLESRYNVKFVERDPYR